MCGERGQGSLKGWSQLIPILVLLAAHGRGRLSASAWGEEQ